jgi:HD-GYP domain-containing protein (c-di-GMP phosphodiesterase class II)
MSEDTKDLRIDEMLASLAEEQVDDIQNLARGSLTTMFVLFRLAMMHSLNNAAFKKPMEAMIRITNEYVSTYGSFSLALRGDSFFINNNMIRLDSASFTASEYMAGAFERLGIGTVAATALIEQSDVEKMLESLKKAEAGKNEAERKTVLVGKRFGAISVRGINGEIDPLRELKREIQKSYALLGFSFGELSQLAKQGRFPPLSRIKRLVQKIVDLIEKHYHVVVAIACHYHGEKHEKLHPVNVMIFSILLGRSIGFDRRFLADLGLSALLHDIGMEEAPDNGVWGAEVPVVPGSTSLLTQMKNLNEHTLVWTVASYEIGLYTGRHNLHAKGYYTGLLPGLPARIVALTHLYERMINAPIQSAVSPHAAVSAILNLAAKQQLDPFLTKAFIQIFGIYPIGTIVQLTDGTRAVVIRNHREIDKLTLPFVKTIAIASDEGGEDLRVVSDLSRDGGARRIVRVVSPTELRVNVPAEIFV